MRKFMFLFVLCGLISGQAWGGSGDYLYMDGSTYSCGGENGGITIKAGAKHQVVGKVDLQYNGERKSFTSPLITCYEKSFTKDPVQKWCKSSEFRNVDIPGVRYCLVQESDLNNTGMCWYEGAPRSYMQTTANDSKGNKPTGWCVRAYCREGYVNINNQKCIPVEEVASCTPFNMKHNDGDRLSTSGNNIVYCITKAALKDLTLKSEAVNYCLPGTMYRDKDNSTNYHLCTEEGKWERGAYKKCNAGDECKAGQEGCELMAFDISDQQTKITLRATGQTVVSGNNDSICVRFMCNDATHVKSGNKCITKAKHDANVATANRNRKACEGSGGTWASNKCTCSAQNVSLSGNSCVCNSGYEWNADKKQGCKLTDKEALKTACNAAPAGTTTWNDAAGACVCVNADQTFDIQRKACVDNQDFAACKPLVDRGVATWNSGAKQCVCNQPGYIVQNNNCIESPEAAAERERREKEAAERARAEALRKSRRNISDAHGILVGMRETFKASVWKDEEGKFNTSRLVSDGIAGVVLGTVGGVVTSNVVKKNQVENGFEDIKCTVGGQTVADWGDEFRVGIQ